MMYGGERRVEDLPLVARRWRRPPGADAGNVCRRRREGAGAAATARWRKCLSTPWNQSNLGQKVKQNTKLSDGAIRDCSCGRLQQRRASAAAVAATARTSTRNEPDPAGVLATDTALHRRKRSSSLPACSCISLSLFSLSRGHQRKDPEN